jgi:hypothetical protein
MTHVNAHGTIPRAMSDLSTRSAYASMGNVPGNSIMSPTTPGTGAFNLPKKSKTLAVINEFNDNE